MSGVPTLIVALSTTELYPVYTVAHSEGEGDGFRVPIAADKLAWVKRVSREFAAVQEFLEQLDDEARCPRCYAAKHEGECQPRRFGFTASVAGTTFYLDTAKAVLDEPVQPNVASNPEDLGL